VKVITLGDVVSGKVSFKEYRDNCFERNGDRGCFREVCCYELCCGCPKKELKA